MSNADPAHKLDPMKRIHAVLELVEGSTFDPSSNDDLDELADDLLCITHGVTAVTVYASAEDLLADE